MKVEMPRSRIASLVVFGLGLVASLAWAWWQHDMLTRGEPHPWCATSDMAIVVWASIAIAVSSLASAELNFGAFRAEPKPRSALRILELVILALPAFVAACVAGSLVIYWLVV
jgi:hypothetical protein